MGAALTKTNSDTITQMEKVQTYTPSMGMDQYYTEYARMVPDSSGEWIQYGDYKATVLALKSLLELHDTGRWDGEDPASLARDIIAKSNID